MDCVSNADVTVGRICGAYVKAGIIDDTLLSSAPGRKSRESILRHAFS